MSRVHDALKKAEQQAFSASPQAPNLDLTAPVMAADPPIATATAAASVPSEAIHVPSTLISSLAELLQEVEEVQFSPSVASCLIDRAQPTMPPSEEFRTLRTRLNHIQSLEPIHSIVITSPSPAEGKSFTAANLALAQSHLADNYTLLCDFDFRRPTIHNLFQIPRVPGSTDFLLGEATLSQVIKRVAGTNLFVMPAGTLVHNPLELLNLKEVKNLIQELPKIFNWVLFDTPPLLFSADANLLSTLCDGTLIVVRIGQTSYEQIGRAVQSLCENNVLGIVANGAHSGELYSKYTYYYSRSEEH
ncbi:MAG: CpsD/CapB family tyrosine-protein kinase [Bryobacterales bacterium]|nr:CpsD/CapB family tyrosine-protein kinase [Bryobacterales bacterium]